MGYWWEKGRVNGRERGRVRVEIGEGLGVTGGKGEGLRVVEKS
jgi:hypothetical protein